MANHRKNNPIGKDFKIDNLQKKLYDRLSVLWGVELNGYPRCYVINREKTNTIEYYKGKKEYYPLIHSENNKFFFTSENDVERESNIDNIHFRTNAELFFVVNLEQCKPLITHRADEEVKNDVMNIISKFSDISINRVVTGTRSVFGNLDYNKTIDIHPYHCFKIELTIRNFKINESC